MYFLQRVVTDSGNTAHASNYITDEAIRDVGIEQARIIQATSTTTFHNMVLLFRKEKNDKNRKGLLVRIKHSE